MKARLALEIDGIPEGSDEKFASDFNDVLHLLARELPVGWTVKIAVEVGQVRRNAQVKATAKQPQLPLPKNRRPAPRRSPTARGPPPTPGKIGLGSGILNRPRPRHWQGPRN